MTIFLALSFQHELEIRAGNTGFGCNKSLQNGKYFASYLKIDLRIIKSQYAVAV